MTQGHKGGAEVTSAGAGQKSEGGGSKESERAAESAPGAARLAPRSGEASLDIKVWVYSLPQKFHPGLKKERSRCIHDQYGTEIRIHDELLVSPMRRENLSEAEFFFVPIYGECYIFGAI